MCKNLIHLIALGLLLGVMAGVTHAEIIAYWPFDEGTGEVAKDVIGDVEAQLTDIDWVADQFGGFAGESSGGGAQILADPAPEPTTDDLSIAWWMVDDYDSWHTMMNKADNSGQAGYSILLRPEAEDSPLRFRIGGFQAYGGWGAECRLPGGAYQDGEWVQITCTYDSASDTAAIYVNGELKPYDNNNPKTGIAGPGGYCDGVNDPAQPLYIVGQRETFTGTVDEVAIWDHALSPGEIEKVFTLGPLGLDPRLAGSPSPADKATDIPREVALAWTPGESAVAHDVYLGTTFEDVNDADSSSPLLVSPSQVGTTYEPPRRLEFGTTYYWRIDEVTAAPGSAALKGLIWSFTTEPVAYPVDGQTITVTASSADENQGPENTINGSGLTDDLHSNELTDMWLSAMSATGPAWIEYTFDRVLKLDRMLIWNQNGMLEPTLGLGAKDVTVEYSTDGVEYVVLEGVPEFTRAPGQPNYAADTTVDFGGIAAKSVRLTITTNWGNILAQYGLSEVRFFSLPVVAREASPAPDQTDVDVKTTLSWRAGREAAEHDVSLSTDEQAVIDGTAPVETVVSPSYAAALDLATTYYWRVDEVNDVETPSLWQGELWSFSTQEYIAVDDFESYTNYSPDRLFQTWIDGLGFSPDDFFPNGNPGNGSGSLVGYDPLSGSIMETGTVHAGKQAMPLVYNNTSVTYSETTRTFVPAQDWSKHGIKGLTLWFYGDAGNDAQQMYVKINNDKVPYDGAAESLQFAGWQMWYIDLTARNVTAVQTLTIGFDRIGASGGQGTVLIDDVRLYAYDRQLITPVDPGTDGLQAQYQFEGNASDNSGNGHNGTLQGGATFAAGQSGQAISLDGIDDYVDVANPGSLSFETDFTWAAWIKTANDGTIIARAPATGDWAPAGKSLFVRNGVLSVDVGWVGATASAATVNDDEWHHVAMSTAFETDGDNDTTTLYIDGLVAGGRSDWNMNADDETGLAVKIGFTNSNFPATPWFGGLIDDLRIYDRVLLPDEIASLAGQTAPFDRSF